MYSQTIIDPNASKPQFLLVAARSTDSNHVVFNSYEVSNINLHVLMSNYKHVSAYGPRKNTGKVKEFDIAYTTDVEPS
jgi:hypothetical protein